MKNKKKIVICLIILIVVIVGIAACVYYKSSKTAGGESNVVSSNYDKYKKKSSSDLDDKNIIYHINYFNSVSQIDEYELDIDKSGNYELIYIKYDKPNSNKSDKYYFNGKLSENDLNSIGEIFSQMNNYLEGTKTDYNNYQFYYNYQDVSEQNQNGNKILNAILKELINHTIYNDDGARVSNFEGILNVLSKYVQNPDLDLDAELVFNERGQTVQETPAQFEVVPEEEENEGKEGEAKAEDSKPAEKKSAFVNIPFATGEKSGAARLNRVVIDFVDNATEDDVVRAIGEINSGILFRFKDGNKFIITIDDCENEAQVLEVCNKIKSAHSNVEKVELCYE